MIGWTEAGSELTSWRQTCFAFALAAAGLVGASLQAASSPLLTDAGSGEVLNSASHAAITVEAFGTLMLDDAAAAVVVVVAPPTLELCVELGALALVVDEAGGVDDDE